MGNSIRLKWVKGSQVDFSKSLCISVPEGCFIIANRAEMLHLGLHYLSKYLFLGLQVYKGFNYIVPSSMQLQTIALLIHKPKCEDITWET